MFLRKSLPCLSLLVLFFLWSCSVKKENPSDSADGLIHIDVLEAFETGKNLKLSDFVKDVELVPLESTKDSYFRLAYDYFIGEKYIMIADGERAQIVLFDRNGKFIRTIGKKGKGPGELNQPRKAVMDPNEEYIFVADPGTAKMLKYSTEGEFIKEISTKKISPARYTNGIEFIKNNQFVLVNRRPYGPMDGFASLPVFDMDLNQINSILPRPNDENLPLNITPHAIFTSNPGRMTFWEPLNDTLYTITSEGDATPSHIIGFSSGGPSREFATTNINPNISDGHSISSIKDVGQYIHISGKKDRNWFTALYHHKTKEIFEIPRIQTCDTSGYFNFAGFENDLYGIGTGSLGRYFKNIERFATWGRVERIAEYYDFDCIRDKKVKFPKLRDQFLELAGDPEASYQKILILMELK